jgi:hypothetical protein
MSMEESSSLSSTVMAAAAAGRPYLALQHGERGGRWGG